MDMLANRVQSLSVELKNTDTAIVELTQKLGEYRLLRERLVGALTVIGELQATAQAEKAIDIEPVVADLPAKEAA